MKTRSLAVITLRTSNKLGGHYFVSLKMGHRLHSYQWKDLTLSDAVIDFEQEMATLEEEP